MLVLFNMYKQALERFRKLQEKNPNLGDYIILHKVIEGRKYNKVLIRKLFTKLMSKDQFEKSEKQQLLDYLFTQ